MDKDIQEIRRRAGLKENFFDSSVTQVLHEMHDQLDELMAKASKDENWQELVGYLKHTKESLTIATQTAIDIEEGLERQSGDWPESGEQW